MKRSQLFIDIFVVMLMLGGVGAYIYHSRAPSATPADDTLTILPVTKQPTMNNDKLSKIGIEILTQGAGESVMSGQTAVVDYTGMLTDGTVFDSSIPRGQPFDVHLGKGEVIEGWEIGLVGMKVGEKRKLTIPPELGYGASGFPGVIPPNATLVFEVTLKSFK